MHCSLDYLVRERQPSQLIKNRHLVGDDEHGWSDEGIFNFEGGCYAKCINLKKENERQIWDAIRFGSVMENVILKTQIREPDFTDGSLTENTRVAYPLDFIPGAIIPSIAGHPSVIIFLTADAFGVMPPIAKLTKEGAMYHFMSGYTSKLAGTERGITNQKKHSRNVLVLHLCHCMLWNMQRCLDKKSPSIILECI